MFFFVIVLLISFFVGGYVCGWQKGMKEDKDLTQLFYKRQYDELAAALVKSERELDFERQLQRGN